MATLLQFSKNMRRRGRQVENAATEMTRRIAKASLKSLVRNTKVDKGVARSNWRVGVGSPTRSEIPAYVPYPKGSQANGQGISETANASAAISAGIARINSVKGRGGGGLKTAIFISNHVPYLDNALVAGAIQTATLEARASIRGFRIFVDR